MEQILLGIVGLSCFLHAFIVVVRTTDDRLFFMKVLACEPNCLWLLDQFKKVSWEKHAMTMFLFGDAKKIYPRVIRKTLGWE